MLTYRMFVNGAVKTVDQILSLVRKVCRTRLTGQMIFV
jgi:hypothetical protein